MAVSISGILKDPYGAVARFADIKLVTLQGVSDVIESSVAVYRTDETGAYAIDVEFGVFAVYMRFNGSNGAYTNIQSITVNSDTVATTLSDLLAYSEPLTPAEILQVQELVADAEAAATAAALSETNSAASAAAALISETAAANSVALLAPVPLNGGVWASGQIFTAYNEYMIYDGEAYSPFPATSLPYTVGAAPDLGFVYQIKLNSLQSLSGLDDPSDLDLVYNRQFDTLNNAIAATGLLNGSSIEIKERYSGDGGGGVWDVVLASSVTPNTFDIIQCTGTPSLALVMREQQDAAVINIPTDYPDLQTAVDILRRTAEGKSRNITLFIEAGHALTKGVEFSRGDFSNFQIASSDATVSLDPAFVGVDVTQNEINGEVPRPPLCYGFHAVLPRWNLVVDMGGLYGSGILAVNCTGFISPDSGVINAGFRGFQWRGGNLFAGSCNFSGASGVGGRVQKAANVNVGGSNFDNCCGSDDNTGDPLGAIYVSRSCIVEARTATVRNSGANGILARRSIVTAVDVDASGCAIDAFKSESGAIIDATSSITDQSGQFDFAASNGGQLIASGATVTSPSQTNNVVWLNGGSITVNSATTVDAVTIANTNLDPEIGNFNNLRSVGVVWHGSQPDMIEAGTNSNGTWQKFADGRMVVETGIQNIDITVASGAFSSQITKPTLPQTFISTYHICEKIVGKTVAGGGGADIFVNSCSNSGATGNEWKVYNTGQQIDGAATGAQIESVQIRMQVTGTWK